MIALAEEQSATRAIADVPKADSAVEPENAIPGHAGKRRGSARKYRPLAGIAAIAAERVKAPSPIGGRNVVLPDGVFQSIGRADQELDDMGRRGVPPPGEVVAVIDVIPLFL